MIDTMTFLWLNLTAIIIGTALMFVGITLTTTERYVYIGTVILYAALALIISAFVIGVVF